MAKAQDFNNNSGTIRNLNDGRSEALRGLLSSLNQDGNNQNRSNFPEDQARLLTDTLERMLGVANLTGDSNATMNQRGELLNDEGLPIIEITEPVEEISSSSSNSARPSVENQEVIVDEPALVPLFDLSPAQRSQLRKQRDSILDALEAEESVQTKRDDERDARKKEDEMNLRRAAAKAELDRIRAAKEMQKKMGRALVRNNANELGESRNPEVVSETSRPSNSTDAAQSQKAKKSVSFTGEVKINEGGSSKAVENNNMSDFGDVSIAPIMNGRRKAIKTSSLDKQPMKMDVIERIPGKDSIRKQQMQGDSDDESVHETNSDNEMDDDDSDIIDSEIQDSDPSDDNEESDDEGELDGELDLQEVQRQRKVALEYYKLKNKIGVDIAKVMKEDAEKDDWDQPDVPLEATLSSNLRSSRVSRFKGSLTGSPRQKSPLLSSPSTIIAANIIPAGQATAVKRAIRMGKLQDDQLVGDDHESEDEESMREIMELLRTGQITNIGPLSNTDSPSTQLHGQETLKSNVIEKSIPATSSIREKQPSSESSTPLMTSERSSPKLSPSLKGMEKVKATSGSDYFHKAPTTVKPQSRAVNNTFRNAVIPAQSPLYPDAMMVIESPSYPLSSGSLLQAQQNPRYDTAPVIAVDVLESHHPTSVARSDDTRIKSKKISRFKAERV